MASVVSIRPAIEAAFCSAVRVTLVGSMTPAFDQVLVHVGAGVVAVVGFLGVADLADDDRTLFAGVGDDQAERLFDARGG